MNNLTVGSDVAGKRIITLLVRSDSAKIINTLKEAGGYAYKRWPVFVIVDGESVLVEWPDLTEEQQLRVLYQQLIYMMQEMAIAYYNNAALDTARDAAAIEILTRYLEADE